MEELAIIVEVLEEDLKTCQSYRSSNKRLSSLHHSEYEEKFWVEDSPQQDFIIKYDRENELALSPSSSAPSTNSPVYSSSSSYPSPVYNQGADVFFMNQAEYGMYETDDHGYDDQYGMSLAIEHQVPSPEKTSYMSKNQEDREVWLQNFPPGQSPQQEDWKSMTFFWAQMEREETFLNEISDQELFAADGKGRTWVAVHFFYFSRTRSKVQAIADGYFMQMLIGNPSKTDVIYKNERNGTQILENNLPSAENRREPFWSATFIWNFYEI